MTKPFPHYSPFGSLIPNRSWSDVSRVYRYGINGKEKDFETSADNYDFGARIYDGRLGRWLSLDPLMKKYSSYSSYNSFLNSPIYFKDPNGKDVEPSIDFFKYFGDTYIKIQHNIILLKYLNQIPYDMVLNAYSFPARYNSTNAYFLKLDKSIQFNIGFYTSTLNPTLLIGTLIHEIFHSFLTNLFETNIIEICSSDAIVSYEIVNGLDADLAAVVGTILNYFILYGEDDDLKNKKRDWQHNYMADHGRSEIIKAMKFQDMNADGTFVDRSGSVKMTINEEEKEIKYTSEQWYEALSFSGLEETDAWKKLDEETRNLYSAIIKEFYPVVNEVGSGTKKGKKGKK